LRPRKNGRKAGGARPFGHGLFHIEQQRNTALELVFIDQQNVIHERAHDLSRQQSGGLDGNALGNRITLADRLIARERGGHRWIAAALHADDLYFRRQCLGRDGYT